MRFFTPIVALLSAAMLLTFAYVLRPAAFFGDAALFGIPLWAICAMLAGGLVISAGEGIRRSRRR